MWVKLVKRETCSTGAYPAGGREEMGDKDGDLLKETVVLSLLSTTEYAAVRQFLDNILN